MKTLKFVNASFHDFVVLFYHELYNLQAQTKKLLKFCIKRLRYEKFILNIALYIISCNGLHYEQLNIKPLDLVRNSFDLKVVCFDNIFNGASSSRKRNAESV